MISEKTPVALGLVVIFVGGLFWLSTVFAQVRHNGSNISLLQQGKESMVHFIQSVDRRLARIEGKLDIKPLETKE